MKLLTNGSGTYLTGDAIADAVLQLAVSLANEKRVELVEFPFRAGDGSTEQATLMVGGETRVNAETRSYSGDELVDGGAVAVIVQRLHVVAPNGDAPMSAGELQFLHGHDDFADR